MFKKISLVLIIVALFLITSCEDSMQTSAPPGTEAADNRTQKAEQDKLILSVKTDKEEYFPGEIVKVNIELENSDKKSIAYVRPTPCAVDIDVFIELSNNERIYLNEPGYEPKMCIQTIDTRSIPAKQRLSREVIWDQKLITIPEKMQALPGKYVISTLFNYESGGQVKEIIVLNEIRITGDTKTKVSQEAAIKTAYSNDEVIEWYDSHTGKNLIEEEFGKYFVINKFGKDRIDNITAEKMLLSTPNHETLFHDNMWKINFWAEYGEDPKNIIVNIDAETGDIIEIRKI
ncbi:hypothetical protein JXB41_02220 [Candidatus Woesearchaeota archaeon]|nr:hypothetical protein [Candidatus Woesearchaeota archaeon]